MGINQSEFADYKDQACTKKLLASCKEGRNAAIEQLMHSTGEIGDLPRGAIQAFSEVINILETGNTIVDVEGEVVDV